MKNIVLDPQAIEDMKWWIKQDKKLALKIMKSLMTSFVWLVVAIIIDR